MKNVLLSGMFLFSAVWAAGAVISINADGTGDYPTIQAAIDVAEPNDIIILEPGIYQGPGSRDLDYGGKPLTVRGSDPDNWDVVMNTVIDPQGTSAENHRGFYFHSGETNLSVLEGITIRNGYAEYGGGVLCQNSSPRIRKCLLDVNVGYADYWPMGAGGIHCQASEAVIESCILNGNIGGFGGGLYCGQSSNVILQNSIICGNLANGVGIDGCGLCPNTTGGGIGINEESNVLIEHCTISDNWAFRPPSGTCQRGCEIRVLCGCSLVLRNSIVGGYGELESNIRLFYDTSCSVPPAQVDLSYCNICDEGYSGPGLFCAEAEVVQRQPIQVYETYPYEGDYHLLPQSPCVNAGDPDFDCADCVDIDGQPRTMADVTDVGADELYGCYAGMPDYDTWVEVGSPECWCYPRQCHGDADGTMAGTPISFPGFVGMTDLYVLVACWHVKEPPKGPGIKTISYNGIPGICADFARNVEGTLITGYTRCSVSDLNKMVEYWMVREPPFGPGTPPDCQPGNVEP